MNGQREDGVAIVIVLMAITLCVALGLAVALTTGTEVAVAASYRNGAEVRHAADAGLELAIADLSTVPNWNSVLDGSTRSGFADGPPSGIRRLADGTAIDLGQLINMADCEKPAPCSLADLDAVTAYRPWGANNPRWQLYAYGRLADTAPGTVNSQCYLVVLVGDDQAENDGDSTRDGASTHNPGSGALALRAEAFGPGGVHEAVESTVVRAGDPAAPSALGRALRVLSWRELR